MGELMKDRIAVVYGAAGAIGGAVARALAAEGAKVHLTGPRREPVEALAAEIVAGGGAAEAAPVDALDEGAVDRHLDAVLDRDGRLDASFNAVGISDAGILGAPLTEIGIEQYSRPIADYTKTWFLTARLAARRMLPNGSGVIMTVSALPARSGVKLNGGYGPAQAAKEAMTRDLSAELAPHGLRVLCLRPHALPETATMRRVFELKGEPAGMSWEQFEAYLTGSTHPQRGLRLEEVAGMAVLLASEKAGGMTGTTVNLTMGGLDD